MAVSQLLEHGARAKLYINGALYGLATSFSFDSASPRKDLGGLDSPFPFELAITTLRIMGSMTILKAIGDGGLQGFGIVAPQQNIAQEKYITILLVDAGSDSTIFRADYCQVTRESWSVPTKGLVTGNVSFEGLSWNNDVNPSSQ